VGLLWWLIFVQAVAPHVKAKVAVGVSDEEGHLVPRDRIFF
jgi:hypothetical protein